MSVKFTILGVILLVFSIFLIISVLMQHGKAKNISGAIAGGAETFFGKTKGSTIDKMLSKVTTVIAIIFVIIVIIVYVTQQNTSEYVDFEDALTNNTPTVSDSVDTTADTAADTAEAVTEALTEAAE